MNPKALEIRDRVVGEMSEGGVYSFKNDVTVAEMIGTGDVPEEFLETVTYNLEAGREQIDLLYGPIYETTNDRSLPEILTRKVVGTTQVAFLEKFEGGEVKFGDIEEGPEVTVKMHTWAAGLQFSEDFVEYNKKYELASNARTFGRNYNKLLNELHLGPIVSASAYTTTGGGIEAQRAAQAAGTAQLVAYDTDVKTTLQNALKVLPKGSIILHHSSDVDILADAIASDVLFDQSPGNVRRTLNMANAIAYDGETIKVGLKTYTYTGIAPGTIRIIVPKQNFEELVKHDLLTDSDDGDLSRLILSQLVGRTRRGVLAILGGEEGAIRVNIA